jgi:hypothetical protein
MSAVNESIAREFFEALGYCVSQPCKYTVPGRHKKAEEELDLLVTHPLIAEHRVPEHVLWLTGDLKTVARAVVGVRGWHTERFSEAKFVQTPEVLRFAERAARHAAAARLGSEQVAAILCVPALPASGELKSKALQGLKSRGIDGVLSFHTMLAELMRRADVNKNYDKSDLLQILRILKVYELLREPQMELFGARPRRPRKKPAETPPLEAPA